MSKLFVLSDFKKISIDSLQLNRSKLLHVLNKFAIQNFNPRIEVFEFHAFIEPTRFDISIQLFLMDKNWSEVFNEQDEKDYVDSSLEVVSRIHYFDYPFEQIQEKFYEEMDTILNQALIEFISEVYDASNFSNFDKPTFFFIHDESQYFDLKSKKFVSILYRGFHS